MKQNIKFFIIQSLSHNTYKRVIELDPKLTDPKYKIIGTIIASDRQLSITNVILDNGDKFIVHSNGSAIKKIIK